jgi:DNA polymerase elongation subunit (family B)
MEPIYENLESNNNFIFNTLDWHEFDEIIDDNINLSSDSESDKKKVYTDSDKDYVIKVFGRMANGESVYLRIDGFPLHFYILLPETWIDNLDAKTDHLIKVIQARNSNLNRTLVKYEIVKRKKYKGFTAGKKFNFVRLFFKNKKSMLDTAKMFDNKVCMFTSSNNKVAIKERFIKFDVYESNIDPYIRFMHIQDLQSCGWVQINKTKLITNTETSTCKHTYRVDWSNVLPIQMSGIAPFYICSFDLECRSADGSFPQASRIEDRIIQIGLTFTKYGFTDIVKSIMISLGTCDQIPDCELFECKTERELLIKFAEIIQREDPDILTGYNIFSFDQPYLYNRAMHPDIRVGDDFYHMSKLSDKKCKLIHKTLSSSALGDNNMYYFDTIGRVHIDLMKVVQRDHKLNSYKLDSVAENFFKDKVTKIETNPNNIYRLYSKNIEILKNGNYLRFEKDGEIIQTKYKIIKINHIEGWFDIYNLEIELLSKCKLYWGMVKDDIKPQDIFELYEKTSTDRKLIAEYCIQDCALVSNLINRLEIITNNIGMANVCHVPLHYIFFRGQGIKTLSLVARYCRKKNYLIPLKRKSDSDNTVNEGYEGATVMEPKTGFYRKPITVLDYNSLYPSSMIEKNISEEMFVMSPEFDNLPGYIYKEQSFKNEDGTISVCRFAKKIDEFLYSDPSKSEYGIIPSIEMNLLTERKLTKKAMAKETDPFKKKILDGKQNALKVTANSIYGQLGAPTSPIYFKEGAACTTAIGRDRLYLAKEFVENDFKNIIYSIYTSLKDHDNINVEAIISKHLIDRDPVFELSLKEFVIDLFDKYDINPNIIYGDTDSIFINFDMKDKISKEDIYDKNMLRYCIELGQFASKFLKTLLSYPHNMEYEKTFLPFALMAKKKYIGNKYEDNPDYYTQTSMGVVLKRRDNANIVKKIVGGMVNIMMNEIDIDKTIRFIKQSINDLLKGKYGIHDFITSKTLKANYVDRTRLAHVVLADRMAERDPGNAPQLNDRIPFVAVVRQQKKGIKMLQGEKIEHPDYIKEHNLKIDYLFYLTNQIMNPSIQFLELIMKPSDAEKLFRDFIIKEDDKRIGRQSLTKFGVTKLSNNLTTDEYEFDNLINTFAKPNNNIISNKSKIINNFNTTN